MPAKHDFSQALSSFLEEHDYWLDPFRIERDSVQWGRHQASCHAEQEDIGSQVELVFFAASAKPFIKGLAAMKHPNLQSVLDTRQFEAFHLVALERVIQQPLEGFCEAFALDFGQRLHMFLKVCSAMEVFHSHLWPAGIQLDQTIHYVMPSGEHWGPALPNPASQSGLIRRLFAKKQHRTQQPAAMPAPEPKLPVLITGAADPWPSPSGHPPARDHIRQLGKMLQALGKPCAKDQKRLRKREWHALLEKTSASEPARQYAHVAQLKADIRRFQHHLPLSAMAPVWRYRAAKFVRRHWKWLVPTLILGLLLAFAASFFLWLGSRYFLAAEEQQVAVYWGQPEYQLLPAMNRSAVVTDFKNHHFQRPEALRTRKIEGFWPVLHGGVLSWGPHLMGRLRPAEAGLGCWRLGQKDRAIGRLRDGLQQGDVLSVKAVGYLTVLYPDDLPKLMPLLIGALAKEDGLHDAAVDALLLARFRHPGAVAIAARELRQQLPSMVASQAVACAEAIGFLSLPQSGVPTAMISRLVPFTRLGADEVVAAQALRAMRQLVNRYLKPGIPDDGHRISLPLVFLQKQTLEAVNSEWRKIWFHEWLLRVKEEPVNVANQVAFLGHVLRVGTPQLRLDAAGPLAELILEHGLPLAAYWKDIWALAQDLAANVRAEALRILTYLIENQRVPPGDLAGQILSMLRDKSVEVRSMALTALVALPRSYLGNQQLFEVVLETLKTDHSSRVRQATLFLLKDPLLFKESDRLSLIHWAAGDRNVSTRIDCALMVREFIKKGVLPIDQGEPLLRAALDDKSESVRDAAALGLLFVAGRLKGDLQKPLDQFARRFSSNDGRWEQPDRTARYFMDAKLEAIAVLAEGLVAVGRGPGGMGSQRLGLFFYYLALEKPESWPALTAAMTKMMVAADTNPYLNGWIARNISFLAEQRESLVLASLAPVMKLLRNPDDKQREAAAKILGLLTVQWQKPAAHALAGLAAILSGPPWKSWANALWTIGQIGKNHPALADQAFQLLLGQIQMGTRESQNDAIEAVMAICGPGTVSIQPWFDELSGFLQHQNPHVCAGAARVLARHVHTSDPNFLPVVNQLKRRFRRETAVAPQAVMATALGAMGGDDPNLVNELFQYVEACLNKGVDGRSLLQIVNALSQNDPQHAPRAIAFICDLDDVQSLDRQLAMFWAVRLGKLSLPAAQSAMTFLTAVLHDGNKQFRVLALFNGMKPLLAAQPQLARRMAAILGSFHRKAGTSLMPHVQNLIRQLRARCLALDSVNQPETLRQLALSYRVEDRRLLRLALCRILTDTPDWGSAFAAALQPDKRSLDPHIRLSAAVSVEVVSILAGIRKASANPLAAKQWRSFFTAAPFAGLEEVISHLRDSKLAREASHE